MNYLKTKNPPRRVFYVPDLSRRRDNHLSGRAAVGHLQRSAVIKEREMIVGWLIQVDQQFDVTIDPHRIFEAGIFHQRRGTVDAFYQERDALNVERLRHVGAHIPALPCALLSREVDAADIPDRA